MFAALSSRNYRLWVFGQIVSLLGTWMSRVAQDWLVLELSHGNALKLGFVTALQFSPTLVLSVWGGVLADRLDKRKLVIVTQTLLALCALGLGLVNVTGIVQLWHVYVLAFLMGCVSAIDTPVRQSFTIEMVGPQFLPNAVAINSMVFNSARIVGPSIAGVLITLVGTGWVFMVNAISSMAVVTALILMRTSDLFISQRAAKQKGQIRAGFAYVWDRSDLMIIIVTIFLVSTFGINFPVALTLLASKEFHTDASGYGLLSTALAVGTLSGATWAAKRASQARLRLFLTAGLLFGVFETVAGFMPTLWLAAALLIPTGLFQLTVSTAANSILQLSVEPDMRGRVMGIYMLAFLGGTPLGGPLLGLIADHLGPRSPLIVGGVLSAIAASACALYLIHVNGLTRHLTQLREH